MTDICVQMGDVNLLDGPAPGSPMYCRSCRDQLDGLQIQISLEDRTVGICDACITTLAIKIASVRRRQNNIPPVGRAEPTDECTGRRDCMCQKVGCWSSI